MRCRKTCTNVSSIIKKASDNIRYNELFSCPKEAGRDGKYLRILTEICCSQEAIPRINGTTGKWIQMLKGARQRSVLSPEFVNARGEEIMVNKEDFEGVRVDGPKIYR